jgi:hypothetical protein
MLCIGTRTIPWRIFCRHSFLCMLSKRETRVPWSRLPSSQISDAHCIGASPFYFIRNWTIAKFSIVSTKNWTQEFRNCTHFRNRTKTSIAIYSHIEHILHKYPTKVMFSHIEHISHKYPLKVKFSHKWSYFDTLSIFYTIILLLSVEVLVFWNSWLFHGGHCASMQLCWPMVFLAWSSRSQKEESHQIDRTLPHQWQSQLRRLVIFQV